MISLGAVVAVAVGAAVVAFVVALYKHHTLAAVKTSAKAEFEIIDAEITKLGTAASSDLKLAYAKLKSLF